jgi:hypothetical protein
MEQTLIMDTPTNKIYKDRAIWAGTFLGGPLVTGYLIAENFKAFNEPAKAKKTWIISILATIVIFGTAFLIADSINVPNQIIPLIYTAIAYYIVQKFQESNITAHINAGGQFFSWWRTIGISILGVIITLAIIFGFALVFESITGTSIATKTYGKIKHKIAYDANSLTEAEADKMAEAFVQTNFFDEEIAKYVYAIKENNNYEISLSVIEGTGDDPQALQYFTDLRTDFQALFTNNKIIFKLVVDDLENVVKRIE